MSITLKDESILNEWSMIVDHGAGNEQFIVDQIDERLTAANIPGHCHWDLEDVQSSGWLSKVKRQFLLIRLDQFADYRMYVGIRDYGIHLDCCRFLTVEPGFMKKWAAEKLAGSPDALSAPKNILIHQDLRAWVTVVHHVVIDSVEALMLKLNRNPNVIQRGSKGFLEIW